MLQEAEERKVLNGIRISRESPSVNHIFFSSRRTRSTRDGILETLGMQEVRDQGKYLGLPSQIERSKREVFSYITQRVEERTKGWKGRLLSQAGKEVLIKAVTTVIPNYVINYFLLQQGIIDNLNSVMTKFF
ncbi:hypothetical protein LIER_30823 [Lithospermum erythrorhizon]|uniref:Uncharacterized protein n=1 Tax=Lithospermum erythrorhizon TaxID=34254 RepID=A0AAV3RP00_LITER